MLEGFVGPKVMASNTQGTKVQAQPHGGVKKVSISLTPPWFLEPMWTEPMPAERLD